MFTKIPKNTFDALQVDVGVLLKNFDPANPAEPDDSDLITATTGGITINASPTYSDWGADVDNCPVNMKELKHLDGWDMNIQTTALGTSPELIKLSLGAADIDGEDETKIIPRRNLKQSDFSDLWWVGDKADGGLVAVKIKNALSTAGLSLKTTKDSKGNIALTITGHVSINDQDTMPMEFYATEGDTLAELTLVSEAGTVSGNTAITVSGYTLGSGQAYLYKVGDAAEEVEYDEVLSISTWTAWNGSNDIVAANGKTITIVVVDSGYKAKAIGSTTVVSNPSTTP